MNSIIGIITGIFGTLFFILFGNKKLKEENEKINRQVNSFDDMIKQNQASIDAFEKNQERIKQEIKENAEKPMRSDDDISDFFKKR